MSISPGISSQVGGEFDPFVERAAAVARAEGGITSARLQATLQIGYGRAVRILDQLIWLGVLRESTVDPPFHPVNPDAPLEERIARLIQRTVEVN